MRDDLPTIAILGGTGALGSSPARQLPPGGSVAAAAQELLGGAVMVVSAFQNIGA